MEKLTINQGMIKVAELERNYRYKSPYIINRKKASITYILEADGGRFDCDEKFDFEKELNELISLSEEIEKINIRNAAYLAMRRAIEKLSPPADFALIDGDAVKELDIAHQCVIKGDAKSLSIAAASVLAKVSRDRYITELSDKYPQYNFAKHKGYGTKEHREALLKFGPCEIHRKSFLKKILGGKI